jgi:hypothetical protein
MHTNKHGFPGPVETLQRSCVNAQLARPALALQHFIASAVFDLCPSVFIRGLKNE